MQSIAIGLYQKPHAAMDQPIDDGRTEQGILKKREPLAHIPIAGDDGGPACVAATDDLINIDLFTCRQIHESEIIDDQKRNIDDLFEASIEGAFAAPQTTKYF